MTHPGTREAPTLKSPVIMKLPDNIKQVAMGCKPDPCNFTIKHHEIHCGCTIVIANYGGATFGGDKLIVLRGEWPVEQLTVLDPHFLNEEHPVIARFVPTETGLRLARLCATGT